MKAMSVLEMPLPTAVNPPLQAPLWAPTWHSKALSPLFWADCAPVSLLGEALLGNELFQYAYCFLFASDMGVHLVADGWRYSYAFPNAPRRSPAMVSWLAMAAVSPAEVASSKNHSDGFVGTHHSELVDLTAASAAGLAVEIHIPSVPLHDPYHQYYEFFRGRRQQLRRLFGFSTHPLGRQPPTSGARLAAFNPNSFDPASSSTASFTEVPLANATVAVAAGMSSVGFAGVSSGDAVMASMAAQLPGPTDAVIHFRLYKHPSLSVPIHYYVPPLGYFERVLERIRYRRLWVVAEWRHRRHPTVRALTNRGGRWNATLRRAAKDPVADFRFLASTRGQLLISHGTFSWMAAFLSDAAEVHVPYLETAVFSEWSKRTFCVPQIGSVNRYVEAHSGRLCYHHAATAYHFLDDDPRWHYHEYGIGRYFQSAAEVLDSRSPFAQEVMAMRRLHRHGPPWRRPDAARWIGGIESAPGHQCLRMSNCDVEWVVNGSDVTR